MLEGFNPLTEEYEGGIATIKILEDKNQGHLATIWRMKHQIGRKQSVIDRFKQAAELNSKLIQEEQAKNHEQNVKIKKLEKKIAQMKASTKIHRESLALKLKRILTKIQEETQALNIDARKPTRNSKNARELEMDE